jgi:hypothetical protein
MYTSSQTEKKSEVPADARLLNAGEKIQKGDLHWFPGNNKWQEVADVAGDLVVPAQRVGFYCRKK